MPPGVRQCGSLEEPRHNLLPGSPALFCTKPVFLPSCLPPPSAGPPYCRSFLSSHPSAHTSYSFTHLTNTCGVPTLCRTVEVEQEVLGEPSDLLLGQVLLCQPTALWPVLRAVAKVVASFWLVKYLIGFGSVISL